MVTFLEFCMKSGLFSCVAAEILAYQWVFYPSKRVQRTLHCFDVLESLSTLADKRLRVSDLHSVYYSSLKRYCERSFHRLFSF